MNSCEKCKHWQPSDTFGRNLKWKFAFGFIPYLGKGEWSYNAVRFARCQISNWRYADIERGSALKGACGLSGKHFEQKEPEQ